MAYETEEEQVEAIKKWWKDNGMSVIGGFAIGLALLFGWRYWQTYTEQQAQMASNIYEQVIFTLEKEETKKAQDIAGKLLSDHSDSPYAILAALNLARQDLDNGDLDGTHVRLQWVIDQKSNLVELTHIARLRKARLFLSQKKMAEAKSLIEGIDVGQFKGTYAELQGDIAIAQGQTDVARKAYTEALTSEDFSPEHREWVQIKLDNLGMIIDPPIEIRAPESATGNPNTAQDNTLTIDSEPLSVAANPSTITQDNALTIPVESTIMPFSTPSTVIQNKILTIPVESASVPLSAKESTTEKTSVPESTEK
ncbi:tetratricopeptide repeat protein [Candidatus Parabeggiatoa sp. HSG14]|uniref:YfgM family protein n=1 Tax=Candidatus Parabeggiatoa sp. HSG14 TaxID=3055593 RepID=UPI0025A8CEE2|nr:tetratricopeptide repeat protein [Thiotrichales bacterium HSG14]